MSGLREAVVFSNRHGSKLFGILHRPADGQAKSAVLLLSPGIKMRVAPHGLYIHMAEVLVAKGLAVLRFDSYGLGDSEGDLSEARTPQVYNTIQEGRYIDDTVDAMDWMAKVYGTERFIAAGLCGGAITGLLAAQQDPRIESLISLGIPVSFEGGEADYGKFLTEGELKTLEGGYLRNLKDPKRWLRLFTFQSDFNVIFKVLRRKLREKLGKKVSRKPVPAEQVNALANTNPNFPPAFFAMLKRKCPMLLLFGGTDRWNFEFAEKFEAIYQADLENMSNSYDKVIVPEANHIFSKPSWRDTMLGHIIDWVEEYYPQAE